VKIVLLFFVKSINVLLMEFKKILFLTLFANIWSVNNADEFMPAILGNKLVLFRTSEDERDGLLDSVATTERIDTRIALKNSLKTVKGSGGKSGYKSQSQKKKDTQSKEHNSKGHYARNSRKDWTHKSRNEHGFKQDGSYSSKYRGDKQKGSYSDTGRRSRYNQDKGHEFEKPFSSDREHQMNSYGERREKYDSHAQEDKGSQLGSKKWSADSHKNQGLHSNHHMHGYKGQTKKMRSHRKQPQNEEKWRENSGYSSDEEQNNLHRNSANGINRHESDSDYRHVYNHDNGDQSSDTSKGEDYDKESDEQKENYDFVRNNRNNRENNRNGFNYDVFQRLKPEHDSYDKHDSHNPKSESLHSPPPQIIHSTYSIHHQTSPLNPQNHKRNQTYDGHYSSSSIARTPKTDSEKWEVNSDENIRGIRPLTNSWSYENIEDNHKNNNKPVIKSWSIGHGFAHTITQKPTVNYGSSNFGSHNKAYAINH
jgi:hypothetical protein